MAPSRSQTVFCELTAGPGHPEVAGACSTGHDTRRYELDAVLSALQKNLRSDSSRDFLRGHSRFTGIIHAIDFTQGGFEVRIRGGWFKFGSRTRVERHAAGATSEDEGQVDSVRPCYGAAWLRPTPSRAGPVRRRAGAVVQRGL